MLEDWPFSSSNTAEWEKKKASQFILSLFSSLTEHLCEDLAQYPRWVVARGDPAWV